MIISELTDKDIIDIDMRNLGNIIHGKTFTLSNRVNTELLKPISKWLDNPDWMKRFRVYEDHPPNWGNYKRRQRRWTKQQKTLAIERLKLYWQEIREKRTFRSEIYSRFWGQ